MLVDNVLQSLLLGKQLEPASQNLTTGSYDTHHEKTNHTRPSFFWDNNDKDLKVCFLMMRILQWDEEAEDLYCDALLCELFNWPENQSSVQSMWYIL